MNLSGITVSLTCFVSATAFAWVPTGETFSMITTVSKNTPIIYRPSCDSYFRKNEVLPNSFRSVKFETGLNGNPLSMTLDGKHLATPTCVASLTGFPGKVELIPYETKEFNLLPSLESEFSAIKLSVSVNTATAGPVIQSDCEYKYKCAAANIIGYDYQSMYPDPKTSPTPDYCALECDCYAPKLVPVHIIGKVESYGYCPVEPHLRVQLLDFLKKKNRQKCSDFQGIPGIHSAYSQEILSCRKNYAW